MSGLLSRAHVENAYRAALAVMTTPDATQKSVDDAAAALAEAVAHPDSETSQTSEPGTGAAAEPAGCSSVLTSGTVVCILPAVCILAVLSRKRRGDA